jgi:ABC-type uncharacterized transport system substrate-binding protein
LFNQLGSKRLQLLHELVPKATTLGFLANPSNPSSQSETSEVQEAARALGLNIQVENANSERSIDAAFANFVHQGAEALLIAGDGFFVDRREQLVALVARHALPASFTVPEQAAAGGLMSYGPSQKDSYRQAGIYTGRLLKGEKAVDLPVIQPTKFELLINLKTAKALGLDVPARLLALSDEVIE